MAWFSNLSDTGAASSAAGWAGAVRQIQDGMTVDQVGGVVRGIIQSDDWKAIPEREQLIGGGLSTALERTPELVKQFLIVVGEEAAKADARAMKNLEHLLSMIQHPEVQKAAVEGVLRNARDENRQIHLTARAVGVSAILGVVGLAAVKILSAAFAPDRRGVVKRTYDDLKAIKDDRNGAKKRGWFS